ncbi:response regulator [Aliterella atlantica]|uniref:PAS/PAC sensor protein n=1 Tax=Aliterella atlantica CENA595 TaxID=1618023 RepID=A0A0D8ZSN7_9CYAN|nr:response regulator [Aliterella atlantica]KJH71377.1 PAS/PAC sensor protein [Aliterella atlantica CENA595]
MSEQQFKQQIQAIGQQMAVMYSYMMHLPPSERKQVAEVIPEITSALSNLEVLYQEMQESLEISAVTEEELLEQNHRAIAEFHYYQNLFQLSVDAFLLTDTNGIILEANHAIAKLLDVPQNHLTGKPLATFVTQSDLQAFRTLLSHVSLVSEDVQNLQINLCPRHGKPFAARLKVATVGDDDAVKALRIGVHDMSEYKQFLAQSDMQAEVTTPLTVLPQSLDGLQVLVVDDEADVRDFITTVLETQGVCVRAVASASAALEELEQFSPDVLVSDIRMPGGDGYSLIRQIRALEARQRKHIPAAAITAYLDEDRAKAISAGFESYLHKLAQPSELIEMVAQLAGRNNS